VTDENFEKRIRAALADAAAEVEPTGTLAGLRARIDGGDPLGLDWGREVIDPATGEAHVEPGGGPMTHLCPARRCPRMVPDHLLMCGIHWRLVPGPLGRAVYTAYAGGDGIGSPELTAAQAAAIRAVNRAIGETDAD
jgi:hypothetical protein